MPSKKKQNSTPVNYQIVFNLLYEGCEYNRITNINEAIKLLAKVDKETQKRILLTTKNEKDTTYLMLACQNAPKAIKPIVDFCLKNKLIDDCFEWFSETNSHGVSAFDCAIRNSIEAAAQLSSYRKLWNGKTYEGQYKVGHETHEYNLKNKRIGHNKIQLDVKTLLGALLIIGDDELTQLYLMNFPLTGESLIDWLCNYSRGVWDKEEVSIILKDIVTFLIHQKSELAKALILTSKINPLLFFSDKTWVTTLFPLFDHALTKKEVAKFLMMSDDKGRSPLLGHFFYVKGSNIKSNSLLNFVFFAIKHLSEDDFFFQCNRTNPYTIIERAIFYGYKDESKINQIVKYIKKLKPLSRDDFSELWPLMQKTFYSESLEVFYSESLEKILTNIQLRDLFYEQFLNLLKRSKEEQVGGNKSFGCDFDRKTVFNIALDIAIRKKDFEGVDLILECNLFDQKRALLLLKHLNRNEHSQLIALTLEGLYTSKTEITEPDSILKYLLLNGDFALLNNFYNAGALEKSKVWSGLTHIFSMAECQDDNLDSYKEISLFFDNMMANRQGDIEQPAPIISALSSFIDLLRLEKKNIDTPICSFFSDRKNNHSKADLGLIADLKRALQGEEVSMSEAALKHLRKDKAPICKIFKSMEQGELTATINSVSPEESLTAMKYEPAEAASSSDKYMRLTG